MRIRNYNSDRDQTMNNRINFQNIKKYTNKAYNVSTKIDFWWDKYYPPDWYLYPDLYPYPNNWHLYPDIPEFPYDLVADLYKTNSSPRQEIEGFSDCRIISFNTLLFVVLIIFLILVLFNFNKINTLII